MTTRIYTVRCPVCDNAEIDVYLRQTPVWCFGRLGPVEDCLVDMDGGCLCRDSDLVDQGRYTEKILEATVGMDGVDIRETEGAL